MDIVIKDLHLNVHMHGMDDVSVEKILTQINKLSIQMAKTSAENKADLDALRAEILVNFENISQDIDRLAATLPVEGGMTQEDVDAFKEELTGIRDTAKAIADKTPEPPAPEA